MKKKIILILSALMLFVGCEKVHVSEELRDGPDVTATFEEHRTGETIEAAIVDEKEEGFVSQHMDNLEKDQEEIAEEMDMDAILKEIVPEEKIPLETLAMEKGLSFHNEESLVAVLPVDSQDEFSQYFSQEEVELKEKDFHILLFTTMDEGETEDFLLIPRYVGTKIRLYESDESTLPIYSYSLDREDMVLLRIGFHKEKPDYRVVVSFEDQEATWRPAQWRPDELLPLGEGFEQIDKKQG